MQQHKDDIVGYIYGDVGSTNINFAVNGQNVKKFDYICAPHKEGHMLVQVMDVTQHSDLKFDEAAKLTKKEERPIIKADVSAIADVIGYRDTKGNIQVPRTPFDAGTELIRADDDLIRNVLGLTAAMENGAYIGLLKGHELPVYLNINVLVQKHICILAKTGGGKSYACGVLVEELLKKKVPLVIIDTHGEYCSLGQPNTSKKDQKNMERYGIKKQSYSSQIVEFSPLGQHGKTQHLVLSGANLEAVEILDLLPAKLSGPQKGVLYQAIKEIKEYKKHFTIRDIIDTVGRSQSNAKWNAIASLESLDAIGVFSETGINPSDIVKNGKCSIINMKGVPPDVQTVVVARLTKQLFDERKAGKIPPFLLIVEEAHNYCPERGFGNAVSLPILRTIASEGRKFGMGLCIVSQRPAKVDKNIISQCNTNIILKVTNPNDLKAIISSVEGLTNQAYDEIQRLPIGVALIAGGSLEKPVMAEIRTRETNHGGQSVEISKESRNPEFHPQKTNYQSPISEEPEEMEIEEEPEPETKPIVKEKIESSTEKAVVVTRVANRLGWIKETNPDEAIRILSEEAAKMDENVYKYLESLTKLGKTVCLETNPKCMNCPMKDGCKNRNSIGHQRSGFFRRG